MPDNGQRRILAYFGHHKCASTWIVEILRQVAIEAGLAHLIVLDDDDAPRRGTAADELQSGLLPSSPFDRCAPARDVDLVGANFVSCITADRQQAEVLKPFRAFHVIRDPRDIIVSAYFSHRNSHPTDGLPHLAAHRAALQEASKDEGLFLEMEFSAHELRELGDWDYSTEDILELKMEDLTARPYETFLSIFRPPRADGRRGSHHEAASSSPYRWHASPTACHGDAAWSGCDARSR